MTLASGSRPSSGSSRTAGGQRPRGEVGATVKRFDVTLEGLRQLRHRVDDRQLEPDDWPLVGALVSKQIERAEQRQERMLAKLAVAAAAEEAGEQEAGGSTATSESTGRSR